ncbi:MAG: serine/threonine-protein kinase [Gemmatimonadaceae bacterium]|nr:serine/threonine-protein kinase [Gemmatimonadaceae bacterium]
MLPDRLRAAFADRYELLRELGAGGMATVYLARDVRHAREVAIKVLHPELAAVLGAERFLSEIRTTASLQHPHILPLFDSGEAAGQLFYVMPFVDGETLRSRLEREKQLPIADAVLLAREVADALQYAHDRGVIHRDIKPENILLQGGHALVADFGIALAVTNAGGSRMTQTGLSLGTPQYMAPEQAMGERTIDARADIYALGAVTYEMIAGEPPFTGPTSQAIVAKVMSTEPQRLDVLRRNVPAHVADAVHHALEKLPADRPASARAFADQLEGRSASPTAKRGASAPAQTGGMFTRTALGWRMATIAFAISTLGLMARWLRTPSGSEHQDAVTRVRMSLAPASYAPSLESEGIDLAARGSHLAFVGALDGGGKRSIWLQSLSALEPTSVPGTDGASAPRLSPDGRRLLAHVDRTFKVITLATGQAQTIPSEYTDATWADSSSLYLAANSRIIRWTLAGAVDTLLPQDRAIVRDALSPLPDGSGLLFSVIRRLNGETYALAQLDPESAMLTAWRRADGKSVPIVRAVWGRVLPTGHLAYVQNDGTMLIAPFDLETLHLTGPATPLMRVHIARGYLGTSDIRPQVAIGDDGTLAYAPAPADSTDRLYWLSATNEVEDSLRLEAVVESFALSPDESQVVLAQRRAAVPGRAVGTDTLPGVDIVVLDLRSRSRRVIATGGQNIRPSWSPDGHRILYVTDAGVAERLADASAPPTLVLANAKLGTNNVADAAYAPGGRILIRTYPGNPPTTARPFGSTSRDIFVVDPAAPVGAPDRVRPIAASAANETYPRLSPNGRWIAFQSGEMTTPQVYVMRFPDGGDRLRVSTKRGNTPEWTSDGTRLVFRSAGSVEEVQLGGDPLRVIDRRAVIPVEPDGLGGFSLRRRGGLLLLTHPVRGEGLVLVRNWFAEVRALGATSR